MGLFGKVVWSRLLTRSHRLSSTGHYRVDRLPNGMNHIQIQLNDVTRSYLSASSEFPEDFYQAVSRDFGTAQVCMLDDDQSANDHLEENVVLKRINKHIPLRSHYMEAIYHLHKLSCKLPEEKLETSPIDTNQVSTSMAIAKRASMMKWLGLSAMGFQFGFLFELIWQTYSWDIMEPVTYFVTFCSGTLAAFCYFVHHRRELEYSRLISNYVQSSQKYTSRHPMNTSIV